MKILSERSYAELADHRAKRIVLVHKYRALEREHQELLLLLGSEGLMVEKKPEVPAQPARLVLRRKK